MNSSKKLLPREVAAIVQHVELHRSGWWDKAVQRLIIAAIWLSDKPPTTAEIQLILKDEFQLVLSKAKILLAIESLEEKKAVMRIAGPAFQIPLEHREQFEVEIAEAEQADAKIQEYFSQICSELCGSLKTDDVWKIFESDFFAPLIKEVGANAYRLVSGQRMHLDKSMVTRFLKKFDNGLHDALQELVSRFLDPKNIDVRKYVSRQLHATFCVEAGGLTDEVIQKLSTIGGRKTTFRVFVDTNFLFSILALHENPSNEAAKELQELINTLNGNIKIELFVTPRTIDEAKNSISLAKSQLDGIPERGNFTGGALRVGFSGMAERFLNQRLKKGGTLSADDWFDPYLNNFISIARGKGVELFNEKLDSYSTRPDVVDDIHLVLEAEKRRARRPKTFEMVEHDMILWHMVNDHRPAYVESPTEAKDWILTVDFRFIGFDEHKQKQSGSRVPVCLHPTSLIQLLQFWVPRSPEFEEAILGSLRLPFLFQQFDPEAERTSLRIIKGMGRFEESDHLSEDAIADVVLNEGLRARMKNGPHEEDEENQLIRDAILEQLRITAETEAARAKALTDELAAKTSEAVVLDADAQQKATDIEVLKNRLNEEVKRADAAEATADVQNSRIAGLEERLECEKNERMVFRARFAYALIFLIILGICTLAAWGIGKLPTELSKLVGLVPMQILTWILAFVVLHLSLELLVKNGDGIANLGPFRLMSRFRAWLWGAVFLCFVFGVVQNLWANRIQNQISEPAKLIPSPPLKPNPADEKKNDDEVTPQ